MRQKSIVEIQDIRDELIMELHEVYAGSPNTTYTAYRKAQNSLKRNEEMTFSDSEIDDFLPKELKRGK